MSVTFDHIGIPAADPEASAVFLGEILCEGEITPDGRDGDMFDLSVGQRALTYVEAPIQDPHHIAFRVSGSTFHSAIERLGEKGVPFGNDPSDPANEQTADPLGGLGRIYFRDEDGHLFELTVPR
jgi:catechol 2,3-dioxygenase-like lactoylglutathione lyase family enzyme